MAPVFPYKEICSKKFLNGFLTEFLIRINCKKKKSASILCSEHLSEAIF